MRDYRHYMAFISHRSTDHAFAEWLLKKLEHYPIGSKIRKKYDIARKYVKPICIDQYEFASKDLQKEMRTKLDNSDKMVLLCSRASAGVYNPAFDWKADPSLIEGWTYEDWMANADLTGFVGFEIAYMLSQGRQDDILAVIVDGDPVEGDCFHPLVREWMKKDDIYYDFSAGAKTDRKTFLKLVSAILGIENFSEIFDHDAKRKRLISAGIAGLSAAAVAAGVWAWGYFLPHEKHFADYVMVNGIPQGIEELAGSEYASSSDHYVITTTQASHRITLEHVNAALTPIEEVASARVDAPMIAVYQCRPNWKPDTVEFRDRNGIVQMAYAYTTDMGYATFQENEYTSDQVYPTTQTDDYGIPIRMKIDRYDLTFDDNGFMTRRMYMSGVNYVIDETGVAGEAYTYDGEGRITGMRYLNSEREVAANQNGVAGIDYLYDEGGRLVRETFVGVDGNAVYGTEWYSYVTYDYSSKGELVTATYFSPEGEEVVCADGYSRAERTYDGSGNMVREEFFGPEGEPLYCDAEYHTGEYAYNDRGDCISAAYFNHEGTPTLHADGYAKIEWDRDANGNAVETRYFSTEDTPMPSETYAAVVDRVYNDQGFLVEETNYGANGSPIITAQGYFKKTISTDRAGRPLEIAVYGIDGQPVYHEEMYHKMAFSYDDRGNLSEIDLFGTNGKPIPFNGYWAKQKRTYNGGGQVTSTSYEDRFGNPVTVPGMYARLENTYDDRGLLTSTSYYDTAGNLTTGMTRLQGGAFAGDRPYAAIEYTYDEAGNMVTATYIAEDGEPIGDGGVAMREYVYDEVGRTTRVRYFKDDGQLVESYEAITVFTYDGYGRLFSSAYYDSTGTATYGLNSGCFADYTARDYRGNVVERLRVAPDGSQVGNHYKIEYDERGLEVRRDFYDTAGNPVMTGDGYASLLVEYNDAGKRIKTTALDTAGNPVVHSEGFAIATRTYAENGELIGMDYFDAEGNPVDLPAGYSGYRREMNDFRHVTDATYYDKTGTTLLHYTASFQDFVYKTSEAVFGKNDEPIADRVFQVSRIESTYDENGQQTSARYYGVDGEPRMLMKDFFSGWTSEYENGQESRRTYLGPDGEPFMQRGGFASVTFERNALGQEIRRSYFDQNGEPVNTVWGFAVMEVAYDDAGEIETAAYYDVDGKPVKPAGSARLIDMYLSDDFDTMTVRDPSTGESVEIAYQIEPSDVRMLAFEDVSGETDMLRQPYFPLLTGTSDVGDFIYMSLMSYIPQIDEQTEAADLSGEEEMAGWQATADAFVDVLQAGSADDLMSLMDLSAVEGVLDMLNPLVNEPKTLDELMGFYRDLYQGALDDLRGDLSAKYGDDFVISYEILDVQTYDPEVVAQVGEQLRTYLPEDKRDAYNLEGMVILTVRYTVSGSKGSGMETGSYLTPALTLFKINGEWTLGSGNGFPDASRDELSDFFGGFIANN